jgi:hypothetical protein
VLLLWALWLWLKDLPWIRSREMTEGTEMKRPRIVARTAGIIYVLVFVTGIFGLLVRTRLGLAAGVSAGVLYIAVTLLFYYIFKPVSRRLSLLAVLVSLIGCVIGPLGMFVPAVSLINPLVFFGIYCLLVGYLILRSTFLPRILGVLMAFAGVAWLTFLWPPLANALTPYVFALGMIGEGSLTIWLVVIGVNEQRWQQQALQQEG